jgi:hypothetical protein
MLRRIAQARTSIAAEQIERSLEESELRRDGVRRLAALGRIVALVPTLLAATIAGSVFLVLLPICGIASGAEGIARWCWRLVCDSVPGLCRGVSPHH